MLQSFWESGRGADSRWKVPSRLPSWPAGDFDLSFEDKDGPVQAHGSYATDVSKEPWKLTITLNPEGTTTTARTVMALLSDNQLLIQKTQPDSPMPERFTKDSVILDKVP